MRRALGFVMYLLVGACAAPRASAPPAGPAVAAPAAVAAPSGTPGEQAVEKTFAPVVAACERGDAVACGRLARRLSYVTNERESARIVAALAKGCAAHAAVACSGQATALAHGEGVAAEPARGLAQLEALCAQDEPLACAYLAEIQLKGELGVTGKEEDGKRLAQRTCDKHGGWACMAATASLDEKKDGARMLSLGQRACDGGDATACYGVGQLYAEGQPGVTAADPAHASTLYAKGCDGDLGQACSNLAWQFLRGTGAPKDEKRGRELLERSCTLGDASGCDELARRDGKARLYCDMWGAQACFDVAAEVSQAHGETAEAAEDIISAGTRACLRGHEGACRIMSHVAKDFVRWCDAKEKVRDTCTFAGVLHARMAEDSRASAPERAEAATKARAELTLACEAGSRPACEARQRLAP